MSKNTDDDIELDDMEVGDWEPWPSIWNMLPSKSAILPNGLIYADESPVCTHEPIDVGFSKVKLVCKKCDKDL